MLLWENKCDLMGKRMDFIAYGKLNVILWEEFSYGKINVILWEKKCPRLNYYSILCTEYALRNFFKLISFCQSFFSLTAILRMNFLNFALNQSDICLCCCLMKL